MTHQLHGGRLSTTLIMYYYALSGPFWCAEDNISKALSSCMTYPSLISVTQLVSITYSTALTNAIDHPINMKDSRVYLFSGTQDSVVKQGIVTVQRTLNYIT